MPTPHEGGCFCDGIRYAVSAEPLTLYACHCTDCQRQTGSSFALSMILPRDALSLLRGDPRHAIRTMPDGRRLHSRFCGECGSHMWGEPPKFPQVVVLRPGTLDDTSWLRPVGHIWTRSAQPWESIPEGTLSFDGQPPDPMALIEEWRRVRGASPEVSADGMTGVGRRGPD